MSAKKTKSRKTYSSEFKTQAIGLAKELGVKNAAEKLGIPGHQTLAANSHSASVGNRRQPQGS